MKTSLSVLALTALILVGAGCTQPSDDMLPVPEPGTEQNADTSENDDLEYVADIGHEETAETITLKCSNDLTFVVEAYDNGSYAIILESGSSAFLPEAGVPVYLEEAVSGSGARYEEENGGDIVVTEKAGEFTVESQDRIAAEGCMQVE